MASIPPLPPFLDTALDRTLVGYGKLGYLARRPGWSPPPRLDGRVAVVTGAKSGLGRATAKGLAELGATVRMAVRGREDGERVRDELLEEVPGADLVVDVLDVSSLADVREYAASFEGPLHALVHNAGVMPPERSETDEGHELMLATHVLGPHALTRGLRPAMARGARVIWIASGGMYAQRLRPDDLQYLRDDYKPAAGYARTKRAQVVLSELWAEELAGDGIASHAMHPGWADTPGIAESLPGFHRIVRRILRTHEQGADTIVWLAASAEGELRPGRFWHDRRERPTHYTRRTRESAADRRALWDACETLTASP